MGVARLSRATGAAVFAAVCALAGLTAPTASAATSCYGASCNGLDPSSTSCANDARTVQTLPSWNVELRYSPSCRAAWARAASPSGVKSFRLEIRNDDGTIYKTSAPAGGGKFFTRMVNDKDIKAWVCTVWTMSGVSGEFWDCSQGY